MCATSGSGSGQRLANPDAIEMPEGQIEAVRVFVAEQSGSLLGLQIVNA